MIRHIQRLIDEGFLLNEVNTEHPSLLLSYVTYDLRLYVE